MKTALTLLVKTFLVITAYAFASACGQTSIVSDSESNLGIDTDLLGSNLREFHSALHFPHGFNLIIPGYVIGIEKSPRSKLRKYGSFAENLLNSDDDEYHLIPEEEKVYNRIIGNSKSHLVTHIMKYDESRQNHLKFDGGASTCSLYSALSISYQNGKVDYNDDDPAKTLSRKCPLTSEAPIDTSKIPDITDGNQQPDIFAQSITSLRSGFRHSLIEDIERKGAENKPYTHIIVATMGWNTTQKNSIQNFNSIMGHLLDEVESVSCKTREKYDHNHICSFNPLFVGVTWPSNWKLGPLSFVPETVVTLFSFPNKANDAKEIGATWLKEIIANVKVARAEAKAGDKPKIVLLGHSFGSRATMEALVTHAFIKDSDDRVFETGDMFIGLESAFRTNELKRLFVGDSPDSQTLKSSVENINIALVASEHDKANKIPLLINLIPFIRESYAYTGTTKAFDQICTDKHHELYEHTDCKIIMPHTQASYDHEKYYGFSLCRDTDYERQDNDNRGNKPPKNLLLVDASSVVNCDAAFTGGAAHSDIYRRETSRLILDLIYQNNVRSNQATDASSKN